MANNNVGPHRLVVGAHYGVRDWLAQRVTAIIMAVYTVILLACFFSARDFSYVGWSGLLAQNWMKVATFVTLLAVFYHAWVGMRNVWMDYVKPLAVRLSLQILTIIWLIACAGYAAQILWKV